MTEEHPEYTKSTVNLPSRAAATAPQMIWLQLGDDDEDAQAYFGDLGEVSWADNEITIHTVKYIRADLVSDLSPVISWLENGCAPKEAAKELRLYQQKLGR